MDINANTKKPLKPKKSRWLVTGGIFTAATVGAIVLFLPFGETGINLATRMFATSITLTAPPPLAADHQEAIVIDVLVNNLPDLIYPAVSLSVIFDPNYLEFTGIRQGTMRAQGASAGTYQIPLWNVDVEASNARGVINTMYLDMTGGDQAYIIDKNNILLRLVFQLQDSAVSGDIYHLIIEDATFATINPDEAVSTANQNLRAFNAQIIVY